MSEDAFARADSAAKFIRAQTAVQPRIAVVLGSGLGAASGSFVDRIEQPAILSYDRVPGFPHPTVDGHSGRLITGTVADTAIALMQGRVHAYEGYTPEETTFPIRVLGRLGITTLILTNAAGGVRLDLNQGQLVLISDQINLTGRHPLVGPNDERFGPRFFDMTQPYSPRLRALAHAAWDRPRNPLPEGVYLGLTGPNYETAAEIRAFRTWGADLVGMSTVHETIVARHMGMEVLGISCVTNMAAGVLDRPLSHEGVIETGARAQAELTRLLVALLPRLDPGI